MRGPPADGADGRGPAKHKVALHLPTMRHLVSGACGCRLHPEQSTKSASTRFVHRNELRCTRTDRSLLLHWSDRVQHWAAPPLCFKLSFAEPAPALTGRGSGAAAGSSGAPKDDRCPAAALALTVAKGLPARPAVMPGCSAACCGAHCGKEVRRGWRQYADRT